MCVRACACVYVVCIEYVCVSVMYTCRWTLKSPTPIPSQVEILNLVDLL